MGSRTVIACTVAIAVAGCAAAGAATHRLAPGRGVEIQQGFDRAGNPSLLDNAESIGATPRMRWVVCHPDRAGCGRVAHGLRQLVPTAQSLNPGRTPPGTFFEAIARDGGRRYVARTSAWLGRVTARSRPSVRGRARVGSHVWPIGGSWSGGWSSRPVAQTPGGWIMDGTGPDQDQLNIEACRTAAGEHCLNLSPQRHGFCLYSPQPVRVPARFAGWYLFAFDQRFPHTQICGEPGFGTPESEPTVHPSPTATRSAPLGPISGSGAR